MTTKTSNKEEIKVIFDSNAFFVPLQFKIDIFDELKTLLNFKFKPILLLPIKKELETIAEKGSPKMRKQAIYALKTAEKCTLFEVNDKLVTSPDNVIIKTAKRECCIVFTNDKELRKRLRNINVPVVYVRQKSRLEIDGRL